MYFDYTLPLADLTDVKTKMSNGLSNQNLMAETLLKTVSEKEELTKNINIEGVCLNMKHFILKRKY